VRDPSHSALAGESHFNFSESLTPPSTSNHRSAREQENLDVEVLRVVIRVEILVPRLEVAPGSRRVTDVQVVQELTPGGLVGQAEVLLRLALKGKDCALAAIPITNGDRLGEISPAGIVDSSLELVLETVVELDAGRELMVLLGGRLAWLGE
jgi:hypothetical protein